MMLMIIIMRQFLIIILYINRIFSNINDSDYVFIDVYDFKKYSPHILNFNKKIILLLDNDFDLKEQPFFCNNYPY